MRKTKEELLKEYNDREVEPIIEKYIDGLTKYYSLKKSICQAIRGTLYLAMKYISFDTFPKYADEDIVLLYYNVIGEQYHFSEYVVSYENRCAYIDHKNKKFINTKMFLGWRYLNIKNELKDTLKQIENE